MNAQSRLEPESPVTGLGSRIQIQQKYREPNTHKNTFKNTWAKAGIVPSAFICASWVSEWQHPRSAAADIRKFRKEHGAVILQLPEAELD